MITAKNSCPIFILASTVLLLFSCNNTGVSKATDQGKGYAKAHNDSMKTNEHYSKADKGPMKANEDYSKANNDSINKAKQEHVAAQYDSLKADKEYVKAHNDSIKANFESLFNVNWRIFSVIEGGKNLPIDDCDRLTTYFFIEPDLSDELFEFGSLTIQNHSSSSRCNKNRQRDFTPSAFYLVNNPLEISFSGLLADKDGEYLVKSLSADSMVLIPKKNSARVEVYKH